MTDPIRWGFVGPGRIATNVAGDMGATSGGVLHAVASRSIDRARAFADAHGAERAYGSYGELLRDPDVDAVYIATPHRQHHAIALAAIGAGKHLLVEKAFTCTLAGAREVADAARAARVFCMEAMWTRFQPALVRLREVVDAGGIGELRAVRADLGVVKPYAPDDRLWDPAQGGGALLDLGVYPVSFVQWLFGGAPAAIDVAGTTGDGGVDVETALLWHAGEGRTGIAHCSLRSPLPGVAGVFGTTGWIEVPPRFHHPSQIRVHPVDDEGRSGDPRTIEAPATGAGYAHEFDEVHRCLAEGLTESPTMPLDDTLTVMRVLEEALHALGVQFDEATDVPI